MDRTIIDNPIPLHVCPSCAADGGYGTAVPGTDYHCPECHVSWSPDPDGPATTTRIGNVVTRVAVPCRAAEVPPLPLRLRPTHRGGVTNMSDIPEVGPLNRDPVNVRPPFDQWPDPIEQRAGESIAEWRARYRANYLDALREAIGPDIALGDYDREIIDWLASWDASVVGTVCSLFYRLRATTTEGDPQ